MNQSRGNSKKSPRGERLQKVLAWAGVGSRRECEELITQGRVEIDDNLATELGVRVDPDTQSIFVDGEKIIVGKRVYVALNKPRGVVCTNSDPEGRTRAIDLVQIDARLFPIGRLDRTSEGLIILTNDGEFANRIAHPRYGLEKVYIARVKGVPSSEDLRQLTQGVHLAEGFAKAKRARLYKKFRDNCEIEIVLDEGRNREVRRLLAAIDHKVLQLKRVAIGPLMLGSLTPGQWRRLSGDEIAALKKATSSATKKRPTVKRKWTPTAKKKGQAGRRKKSTRKSPRRGRRG